MKLFIIPVTLFVVVMLMACGAPSPEVNDEEPPVVNDEDFPAMGRVEMALPVDGGDAGYPERPVEVIGAQIHLAHDGEYLYVHLEADVNGWIAVGFNARGGGMDGANMLIGYFDEDIPSIRNDVGRGRAHAEANTTGVRDFILLRENGTRILEFSYPLRFPDDDAFHLEELIPKEMYTLIVAYNDGSDDIGRKHSRFATIDFVVVP